jgi:hypothetical protein
VANVKNRSPHRKNGISHFTGIETESLKFGRRHGAEIERVAQLAEALHYNRKIKGSISDRIFKIFDSLNPSGLTVAQTSTRFSLYQK